MPLAVALVQPPLQQVADLAAGHLDQRRRPWLVSPPHVPQYANASSICRGVHRDRPRGYGRRGQSGTRQCVARRRQSELVRRRRLIVPDTPEGIVRMALGQGTPAMLYGKVEMSATDMVHFFRLQREISADK